MDDGKVMFCMVTLLNDEKVRFSKNMVTNITDNLDGTTTLELNGEAQVVKESVSFIKHCLSKLR